MSKNVISAANQQGSYFYNNPSETTRQAPFSKKEIKAYFLGALHDGTYSSNGRFRISQKDSRWLVFLKKILRKTENNSWIYKEGKDRDVYVLETLASFLDFSFNPLTLKTRKEKRAYLRGFFDAEGGIPHNSSARFYIQLTQSNKNKLNKLKSILKEFNITTGKIHNPSSRVDPNYWRMYVLSRSQRLFIREIGTWHPKKIEILKKRVKI